MSDFSINLIVLGYLFAGMAHAAVLLWLLGHPARNPMKQALCIWEFLGLLWHVCMGITEVFPLNTDMETFFGVSQPFWTKGAISLSAHQCSRHRLCLLHLAAPPWPRLLRVDAVHGRPECLRLGPPDRVRRYQDHRLSGPGRRWTPLGRVDLPSLSLLLRLQILHEEESGRRLFPAAAL